MLKPRALPPVHKNQLLVPVQFIGFFDDPRRGPRPVFRNHEVARKKLRKNKRATGFPHSSASSFSHPCDDTSSDEETFNRLTDAPPAPSSTPPAASSSKKSVTSLIHIRGRASTTDVTAVNVESSASSDPVSDIASPRKSQPLTSSRGEETDDFQEDNLGPGYSSFLTEDPTSSGSCDVSSTSNCRFPSLGCSKYNVIGESKSRNKRPKNSMWTLPTEKSPQAVSPRINLFDLQSIYAARSKAKQVPPSLPREETIVLPPLEIGGRRQDVAASLDAHCLAEKRLVMASRPQRGSIYYRKLPGDQISLPFSYKPYFRHRQRRKRFDRTVFSGDSEYAAATPGAPHHPTTATTPSHDISPTNSPTAHAGSSSSNNLVRTSNANDNIAVGHWESHQQPVHCARCVQQSGAASLQYCDVLGRRFCRFCNERTDRASLYKDQGRLLVRDPFKTNFRSLMLKRLTQRLPSLDHRQPLDARMSQPSPQDPLQLQPELSFIGVRKVVITRNVKDDGHGQGPEYSYEPPR